MVEVTLGHFQSKQKTDNLYFLSQRTFSTGALELDVRFMSTLTTFGWRDHRELSRTMGGEIKDLGFSFSTPSEVSIGSV